MNIIFHRLDQKGLSKAIVCECKYLDTYVSCSLCDDVHNDATFRNGEYCRFDVKSAIIKLCSRAPVLLK